VSNRDTGGPCPDTFRCVGVMQTPYAKREWNATSGAKRGRTRAPSRGRAAVLTHREGKARDAGAEVPSASNTWGQPQGRWRLRGESSKSQDGRVGHLFVSPHVRLEGSCPRVLLGSIAARFASHIGHAQTYRRVGGATSRQAGRTHFVNPVSARFHAARDAGVAPERLLVAKGSVPPVGPRATSLPAPRARLRVRGCSSSEPAPDSARKDPPCAPCG
jgi:hypothetical protein